MPISVLFHIQIRHYIDNNEKGTYPEVGEANVQAYSYRAFYDSDKIYACFTFSF